MGDVPRTLLLDQQRREAVDRVPCLDGGSGSSEGEVVVGGLGWR